MFTYIFEDSLSSFYIKLCGLLICWTVWNVDINSVVCFLLVLYCSGRVWPRYRYMYSGFILSPVQGRCCRNFFWQGLPGAWHHRCAFTYPSLLFSLHLLFHFLLILFTNGNKPRVFFSSKKALFSSPLSSHTSKKCNITYCPLPKASLALSPRIFIRFSYFHYVYFFDRLNHCLLQRLLITK